MARLRKRALVPSALLCLGAAGFWWSPLPIRWVSKSPAAFPAVLERTAAAVARVADVAPASSLVHMGHRGGSFQEFAKNLQEKVPAEPTPVVELMERAFGDLGLNAIEVDVRVSPLNGEDVVVVHDRIDLGRLDAVGRAYAEENTVQRLVEAFLAAGHHLRGKRLSFEIKAPREGLDDEGRAAVDRLARTLNRLLSGRADEARARAGVDLLSFNHDALSRLRGALGPAGRAHGLYQIVTSNQYPEALFVLGTQPPFGERLQEALRETPWLRGVIFDPRYVDGFGALFNGINEARVGRGLRPLEVHVSTLSYDLPGLVSRLAEGERLRHLQGFMYEVRAPAAAPQAVAR